MTPERPGRTSPGDRGRELLKWGLNSSALWPRSQRAAECWSQQSSNATAEGVAHRIPSPVRNAQLLDLESEVLQLALALDEESHGVAAPELVHRRTQALQAGDEAAIDFVDDVAHLQARGTGR